MQVRWLRTALLEAAYIATEDPAVARLVVGRIVTAVNLLAGQPALGKPGRLPGTRELLVPKMRYLIPYRIRADQIEILRVFHTSQKPPKSW